LQLAKHHSKEVQEFVTACVEIAWLCVVQDPPLELDAKFTDRFDTKVFKDYTKRGELVDFMVWPAMFLHKGGPLLPKVLLKEDVIISLLKYRIVPLRLI
jgi:hypothetical protein